MRFRDFIKRDNLNEDVPVTGEYDTWYPSLRTGVSTRSQTNDVYLFKDIANALNITAQNAVDFVSQRLFDRLFPNNQPNPANTEEEYRDAIFNALTEIVNEINRQANTDIKNSKSQKIYTSRIISTLGQAVKTFDGAAPRVVRAAINRANQQVLQDEPAAAPAPLSEIDKLKNRLHSVGSGEGINITKNSAKTIYGLPDSDNITDTDLIRLIKKVKETAFNMINKSPGRRIAEYMRGTLSRFATPVTVPFTVPEGRVSDYASHLRLDTTLPRVKLSYETALANRVVSPRGRQLIQKLVNRFNVSPKDVYITGEYNSDRGLPVLRIMVSLRTVTNNDIIYKEFFAANKRVYDPLLLSSGTRRTLHEVNQILTTREHRVPRLASDFYLQ